MLLPGVGDTFIAAKALTQGIPAGRISVVLIDQDEGGSMKLEKHPGEEALLMISGEAKAKVGDDEFVIKNGDCLQYSARLDRSITFTGKGKNKAMWVKVVPGAIKW